MSEFLHWAFQALCHAAAKMADFGREKASPLGGREIDMGHFLLFLQDNLLVGLKGNEDGGSKASAASGDWDGFIFPNGYAGGSRVSSFVLGH